MTKLGRGLFGLSPRKVRSDKTHWTHISQSCSSNKHHKEHLVEDLHRFVELNIPQERGQVLEEIDEQLGIHGPPLEYDISRLHQKLHMQSFRGVKVTVID